MKTKVKNLFYTGLVSTLPVILTMYFINWCITQVIRMFDNSMLIRFATDYLKNSNYITSAKELEIYVEFLVYILAIVGIITFIISVGVLMTLVVGRRIANAIEAVFGRLPIIKQIHSTLNQIIGMISSKSTKSYQKVVLIEYPRRGIYSLGFLTNEGNPYFENLSHEDRLINIFVPTSPNPTSGMFIMVPEKDAKILDMKIEDAVKLIISGGAIVPGRAIEDLEENIDENIA